MALTKKKRKLWVIKAGSQMVYGGGPLLIRTWMAQVSELKNRFGVDAVWVTSGAIASARGRLEGRSPYKKFFKKTINLAQKQALSAIGQPWVMDQYNLALQPEGRLGAQVLLTASDLKHPERRSNFKSTLFNLLEMGVVPILNENDAVATEEIQFGDNDALSAQVAVALGADQLVILTDVEGLFEKDPRVDKDARLVRLVGLGGVPIQEAKKGVKSGRRGPTGTGGMATKLLAAELAGKSQISTFLVKGDVPNVLVRLYNGESLGTQVKLRHKK